MRLLVFGKTGQLARELARRCPPGVETRFLGRADANLLEPSSCAVAVLDSEADVVIKGTRVDGIYDSDPEKNPGAVKYDEISFKKVYDLGLEVMDLTAITLCQENNKPIVVFDMNGEGNLMKLVQGEKVGTLVID